MKSIAAVKFGGWIQMVGVIGVRPFKTAPAAHSARLTLSMLNLEQHEPADLASLPLMAIAKNVCLRGVVMGGAEK